MHKLPLDRRATPDPALAAWSAMLGQQGVTPLPDSTRQSVVPAVRSWRLGAATVSTGSVGSVCAVRTAQDIAADCRDEMALVLSIGGEWNAQFGIRRCRVLPKQVVVLDLACSWRIDWPACEQIIILLPRSIVHSLCQGAARLHGRVLRTSSGGMLADHLIALAAEMPALGQGDVAAVELALFNLVAGAISGIPLESFGGRSAALDLGDVAARVRRHVEEKLTDRTLSLESICADLALSSAALSRSFGSPAKVIEHIRNRRLAVAREIIVDSIALPEVAGLAEIFCFRDARHFHRAFEQYFGYGPMEARGAMADFSGTRLRLSA